MECDSIIKAVLTTLDPAVDNAERTKYYKVVEDYKNNTFQLNDLSVLCGAQQHPSVILFGLKCLEHKIKHSWTQLDVSVKGTIKNSLFGLAMNLHIVIPVENERKVVVLVLTNIFVYLIKCEWPQQWPCMLDEFFALGKNGHVQSMLVLGTFLRLYEDVTQFQDVPQPRRRDIISALNDNLLIILSFALDIICTQLHTLKAQTDPHPTASLCREALSMLSGFFDSCRMDVIFQWKPSSSGYFKCGVSEIPLLSLLDELIWLDAIQFEAADFLLLLLKRKSQTSDDFTSRLCNSLLNSPYCVNRLLTLLCTLLKQPSLPERKYNTLLCLSEITALLGCVMEARWTEFDALCPNCNCSAQQQFSCPYQCNHILDCALRITSHPVRMISRTTNTFWLAALQSSKITLRDRLRPFASDLYIAWRNAVKRDLLPSNSDDQHNWLCEFLDSEEYANLVSKCRAEAIRCVNLAAVSWPSPYLDMLVSLLSDLLQSPITTSAARGSSGLNDAACSREWDVLETLLDNTLNSVKEGFLAISSTEQFEATVVDLVQRLLQQPLTTYPEFHGKQLSCACLLMQHVDPRHDTMLLVSLLSQIFACFRRNSTTSDAIASAGKLDGVRKLHMAVASAFFRLTKTCASRIMTHFDAIGTEVTGLWADSYCGIVEKCVLLEALILLCLRLPQPIEVQRDLLKQLVSHVTLAWVHPSSDGTSTPMSALLTACSTGGAGLLSFLGLDEPVSAHEDFQSIYVQMRIALTHNVLALLAASRRLSEPVNLNQLHQITVPLLEPVLPSVLLAARAFNELWLPENRALVHPDLARTLEMPDHLKYSLLSIHVPKADRRCPPEPKTPVDRIRTSLHENHENIFTILNCLFMALSSRLYTLPSNQLALILHQSCCAAFDHMPDFKINALLRLVIRQYIRCCPKGYFATALAPLLSPVVEAVVHRLDQRWNQVILMSQTESVDEKTVTVELLEERFARLLGRTLMDIFRLIYSSNGYEFAPQFSDGYQIREDGAEDVDMAADSKAINHSPDAHQLGALAQTLLAQSESESLQSGSTSDSCSDPLFLFCLAKCLTWPDSSVCLKASHWIPSLLEGSLRFPTNVSGSCRHAKRPLPCPLAEMIFFGVLCGLRVHGKNTETNLPSLLVAGYRVYTAVETNVARDSLRNILAKVLLNASASGDSQQVMLTIQNFEAKLFDESRPLTEKAKRDVFKKVVQPIIGIPLSEQFREPVNITTLTPLRRSNWKQLTRNGDSSYTDTFGLSELFSN